MKIALWILQAILAFAFLAAGGMKLFMPIESLETNMGFVADTPDILVRFIGVAEVTGAIGLIAPALLKIKPWLTPLAAVSLGVVMVMAVGLHISRDEWMQVVPPGVLFVMLMIVAWGRTKLKPIAEERSADDDESRYERDVAHAH